MTFNPSLLLVVFLGGGLGAATRYGVNVLAARLFDSSYPVGTLFINVLGSFLMGVFAEYFLVRSGVPQPMRLFLTTGILGGFTTFSSFSLETVLLHQRGETAAALAYVVASLVLGIGGLMLGAAAVRMALPTAT